jgi:S-formylglutathione hydrolase FrmB
MHLLLPPGYADTDQRYPVLYLLRGHEREWLNLAEDQSRHGRNVVDVFYDLLGRGEIGPMILAVPSLTSDDGNVHGCGIDLLKPWLGPQRSGIGTGRWESYFVRDLVPFVDANWRTLADGHHRGVDGFSLGGAAAVKLAAKYPGLFTTAGAYDGTFFFTTEDGASVRPDDSVLGNPLFDPAFGRSRNLQHATANSPANLVLKGDNQALRAITWMVQYGPEQIEPWGSNFYRGEHLIAALRKRNAHNALASPVLADGDHTWHTADRHMAMTLPIHWQRLAG